MARFSRVLQQVFGATGLVGTAGFGAAAEGTTTTTTATSVTLSTIMSATNWASGWLGAVLGASKFPAVEDMNAALYSITTQLAYLLQQGIPEYDATTTYYTNQIVMKAGTYELYGSVDNGNIGNALSNPSHWTLLVDLSAIPSGSTFLLKANNLSDLANISSANGVLGWAQSIAASGWIKFPTTSGNPYILQLFTGSGSTTGVVNSLPTTFPHNIYGCIAGVSGIITTNYVSAQATSTSTVTIGCNTGGPAVFILAWGN